MNREQPGFRPPQQARSRRTLQRLEDSARIHLDQVAWDELGVASLCRDAGTSVGAFYARFRDKEGLLEHLAEIAGSEFDAMLGWCVSDVENRKLPLLSRMRQLLAALQRYVSRHRGVLRALVDRRRPLPWQSAATDSALDRVLGTDAPADRRRVAVTLLVDALVGYVCANQDPERRPLADIEAVSQMLTRYLS